MTSPAQGPAAATAAARAALATATTLAGLPVDASRARLLRHGSNAVFALPPGPDGDATVARVTPAGRADDAAAVTVRRALDVARWLAEADFPAVRALPDDALAVPQPVAVDGHLVTFWLSLGDPPQPGTTRDLGILLQHFHALDRPGHLDLTPMDPVGRIRRQLAGADLTAPDRAWLDGRVAEVAAAYAALDLPLPPGHLHGDATVANVVVDGAGRATLVDLDLVRTGPREWDLLRTAVYARRLGWHTEAEYQDFCTAYGWDVTSEPGFTTLADLCELLQVAWLADAATTRPTLRTEVAARVATLRSGGSRRSWRAV
jgi:hypothetical protein